MWSVPVNKVLGRQSQEDQKFKVIPGYRETMRLVYETLTYLPPKVQSLPREKGLQRCRAWKQRQEGFRQHRTAKLRQEDVDTQVPKPSRITNTQLLSFSTVLWKAPWKEREERKIANG